MTYTTRRHRRVKDAAAAIDSRLATAARKIVLRPARKLHAVVFGGGGVMNADGFIKKCPADSGNQWPPPPPPLTGKCCVLPVATSN